jgi:hypothetical protein
VAKEARKRERREKFKKGFDDFMAALVPALQEMSRRIQEEERRQQTEHGE